MKARSPSFSLSERGGSCGLCKGEILGTWTLQHMRTVTGDDTQLSTYGLGHTHSYTSINAGGIYSGNQRRSSFTQAPSRNSLCALKHRMLLILKQSISGCRNEPSILEVNIFNIVNHARGWKWTKTGFSEPNVPEGKHTPTFKLFRAELDISYMLDLVDIVLQYNLIG